jgi:hypothetical protein
MAVLTMVAHLAMLDITRIECRNAAIRRQMRAFSSTHGADFPRVSASFILMCQRILERGVAFGGLDASSEKVARAAKRKHLREVKKSEMAAKPYKPENSKNKGRSCEKKRPKYLRLGTHRAGVGNFLRGKRWKRCDAKRVFASANNDSRNAKHDPNRSSDLERQAKVARMAQRSGGDPFGCRASAIRQTSRTDRSHAKSDSAGLTVDPAATEQEPIPREPCVENQAEGVVSDLAIVPVPPLDGVLAAFADREAGVSNALFSFHERNVAKRKLTEEQYQDVKKWCEANQAKAASLPVPGSGAIAIPIPIGNGEAGGHASTSAAIVPMDIIVWPPPIQHLSRGILSSKPTAMQRESRKVIRKGFIERHKAILAASVPKLSEKTCKVMLCRVAGFCLCFLPELRSMVQKLEGALRKLLAKGSTSRRYYDKAILVACVYSDDVDSGNYNESGHWFHFSYINFNTFHMTLLPMRLKETLMDFVILES